MHTATWLYDPMLCVRSGNASPQPAWRLALIFCTVAQRTQRVFPGQWRSRWCLKRIYEISVGFQSPFSVRILRQYQNPAGNALLQVGCLLFTQLPDSRGRQNDTTSDRLGAIQAHGTSRRIRLLSAITDKPCRAWCTHNISLWKLQKIT